MERRGFYLKQSIPLADARGSESEPRRSGWYCCTHMSFEKLEEVRRRHANAEAGGGPERKARQHKEGKLSARERIELLLDEGTFQELDKLVRHRCLDLGMNEQTIDG